MCKVIVMQIMRRDKEQIMHGIESECLHRWQFIKCGAADTIKLQLENTLYMHGLGVSSASQEKCLQRY